MVRARMRVSRRWMIKLRFEKKKINFFTRLLTMSQRKVRVPFPSFVPGHVQELPSLACSKQAYTQLVSAP